jgi:hypothetical protein
MSIPELINEYLSGKSKAAELKNLLFEQEVRNRKLETDIAKAFDADESISERHLLHTAPSGEMFVVEIDEEWYEVREPIKVTPLHKLS